ncbi:hypothetical protein DEO72_LG3g999 [Vigna unguiculata]|uniref:Uncharacterized protein n=1 Tax=Vigna unguiculata TaxID=3917 RepID=A0A4D6LDJ9_VIGUN|nr:hypothetical protein DEO72_LG3g999 [Vigna unguiculata]
MKSFVSRTKWYTSALRMIKKELGGILGTPTGIRGGARTLAERSRGNSGPDRRSYPVVGEPHAD